MNPQGGIFLVLGDVKFNQMSVPTALLVGCMAFSLRCCCSEMWSLYPFFCYFNPSARLRFLLVRKEYAETY